VHLEWGREKSARPATHVADQLEQIVGDRELPCLERSILPKGEPDTTSHLNLPQTEPLRSAGRVADEHGQHL
jgi:hypothetical protein